MKAKVLEIFLIALIVLMLGGILASVKNDDSDSLTTDIVEDFDKNSDFDVDGYVPSDVIDEDNDNAFSRFGSKVGEIVSDGVNKGIDLMFEFFKKLVS